ncbi:ArsA family ATPase [Cryptosporangium aurantiacum]|uniref:Arsenite efflux ATP-binding protein ArsA n=1 Tax=Cryptosporangium aurantiacum TaxID=134849 RepID=A0A1M7NK47_9ACTN|nr:ArsA family ATPase [Cryptosporangium aurantiacum]SHN03817.1 arsenite efflux ATP-binding protein ArsA [Cryptosporangium aurantiacum]
MSGLDIEALLTDADTRIIVCCGSGGVGKTTTAAALGLRAAEAGRRTVVLTIDPARRLAQSMGLSELDNVPRRVKGVETTGGGELHAMMLDMKRTFDEVVLAHTDPGRAEEIFANPFYQAMSSSFSGTQEYMAMEKLSQLRAADEWDLIIVDTPPSRSALDFLDAPQNLARFLDGRLLKLLLAPAKTGGRGVLKVMSGTFSLFSRVITKILGNQLLDDVSTFVAALDSMFGGFRERAQRTYDLLKTPGTAFVVVAAPEPDAVREASYFADRLLAEGMPLAGLVLNRVHATEAPGLSAADALDAAEKLDRTGESPLTAEVLRIHAGLSRLVERERRIAAGFTTAHPDVPIVEVPAEAEDVHDLDGLRRVGSALASTA